MYLRLYIRLVATHTLRAHIHTHTCTHTHTHTHTHVHTHAAFMTHVMSELDTSGLASMTLTLPVIESQAHVHVCIIMCVSYLDCENMFTGDQLVLNLF